ncbi:MAG TPA: tetratricopeptide repeat protein [Opitutaceae bacterium]
MGELLKFPGEANKLGYSRVHKRGRCAADPNQLDLFVAAPAPIESFSPALSVFEQALLCDERGDAHAAELYARAIEQQVCVADAYCNLGILESKKGRAAKAFDCFTTCLKHEPRHSEAHYNLANLYFEVNDFRLAQIHYEMAVEVDPDFANVYFNLALVQSINNDLAAAIATLTKYQQRVTPEEARNADELLRNLKQTLAAKKDSRLGS